ncbi:hypothetical protein ANN_19588 [Periplaneta americana]|uniref:Mos1 transposase HTH domain-containing protein n=1 Tax=Periplaneta americana TaxID=6978 RepID=A0ABQ8SB73_PERAM|nr:hypothetical protein ANN_19588 [Periplaneta americana]
MECQVKKEHFRHIILFEFNRRAKTTESVRDICVVYEENAIGEGTKKMVLSFHHTTPRTKILDNGVNTTYRLARWQRQPEETSYSPSSAQLHSQVPPRYECKMHALYVNVIPLAELIKSAVAHRGVHRCKASRSLQTSKQEGTLTDVLLEGNGIRCRKYDAEIDQEEKKELVGSLAVKKLPTEGCTGRNGEREESSGQKKISDDRQH